MFKQNVPLTLVTIGMLVPISILTSACSAGNQPPIVTVDVVETMEDIPTSTLSVWDAERTATAKVVTVRQTATREELLQQFAEKTAVVQTQDSQTMTQIAVDLDKTIATLQTWTPGPTYTSTATVTSTNTQMPTATRDVPPLVFLSFGKPVKQPLGQTTDAKSWIYWKFGGTGFAISESANDVAKGFGDSGRTAPEPLIARWSFDSCEFTDGEFKGETVSPCNIFVLDSNVIKVTAPHVQNGEVGFIISQIGPKEPIFYQPMEIKPTKSPTPTVTPRPTKTSTPTPGG